MDFVFLGFAVVKLAVEKSTGKKYACKILSLPKSDRVPKDQVTRWDAWGNENVCENV